ncbi:MAG: TRAP transporter small permease subunit [Synergistaceae bacterium]|jgi:TRAP-type C4-dicarboxylate transport system permease small subunit|uniref:TRAP transporter small permease n=1 Tax=Aminivibrio sp. TaxID=1872489 RepID=UPI002A1F1C2C|nr:TRAP transporter small permease subunit [Synergistaceae bacterium]MDD3688818.1 TRAP transporter small permease subunit [Synergistaceae bacterium]MDD4020308.1 TRAP transporter small permease subunit [Synergistaceae bacterium]MDD4611993.1 TRAP transporter small permease subunit [Synergistaceae bacterium]
MLKLLKFLNDKITWILNWLMIVLMSLMVAFIVAQVFFRYVLMKPLSWSEELAGYLFSGVFFFGAILLYRESRHINMSLVVESIKNRFLRELITVIAHLFSFFFLAVMVWYSYPMAMQILEFEVVSPSMEWLKIGYVFLIVPVASFLSLMVMLEVILDSFVRLKESRS